MSKPKTVVLTVECVCIDDVCATDDGSGIYVQMTGVDPAHIIENIGWRVLLDLMDDEKVARHLGLVPDPYNKER